MPKILVVRKSTNLELHGDSVRSHIAGGGFSPEFLAKMERSHEQHYQCLDDLYEALARKNITYETISRAEGWPQSFAYDLVLTVGGDGTLLAASHKMGQGKKIVGVRSSEASVGFLCYAGADVGEIDALVDKVSLGTLPFVEVTRVKVVIRHVDRKSEQVSVPVLNDILFVNQNPAATTRYDIGWRGRQEHHKSSGVWISTPVGSTAATLAAGGQRLAITDNRLQFLVRELYRSPGSDLQLSNEVFNPDTDGFYIENRNEHAILALDGQHGMIRLNFGDRIEFHRGPSLLLASSFIS